jgi:hypothetical protein
VGSYQDKQNRKIEKPLETKDSSEVDNENGELEKLQGRKDIRDPDKGNRGLEETGDQYKNKSESESEVILTKNSGKEKDQEGCSSETVNRQTETSHSEASHLRITGRERKIPVTRTYDFLW